jgi:hypothetical protein
MCDWLRSRTLRLKFLHIEQAREALVRGAARPLAVGLHQFGQFLYSLSGQEGRVALSQRASPHTLLRGGVRGRTGGSRRRD